MALKWWQGLCFCESFSLRKLGFHFISIFHSFNEKIYTFLVSKIRATINECMERGVRGQEVSIRRRRSILLRISLYSLRSLREQLFEHGDKRETMTSLGPRVNILFEGG